MNFKDVPVSLHVWTVVSLITNIDIASDSAESARHLFVIKRITTYSHYNLNVTTIHAAWRLK